MTNADEAHILGTYSNVSHHPRLLRVQERTGPRPLRIRIDPKTGFPIVELTEEEKRVAKAMQLLEEAAEDEADDHSRPHFLPYLDSAITNADALTP